MRAQAQTPRRANGYKIQEKLLVYLNPELTLWLEDVKEEKTGSDMPLVDYIPKLTLPNLSKPDLLRAKRYGNIVLEETEDTESYDNLYLKDLSHFKSLAEKKGLPSKYSSTFINEKMLFEALIGTGELNGVPEGAPAVTDAFSRVEKLVLNRKQIVGITNLDCFSKLKVLSLNNNHIKSIEGISKLQLLEILDLSFNGISQIENLSTLPRLRDLILSSNKIAKVSNIRMLRRLELLFLDSNSISDLTDIYELCYNLSLKSLSLKNNPISELENYHSLILSLCAPKQLSYLDGTPVKALKLQEQANLEQPTQHQPTRKNTILLESLQNSKTRWSGLEELVMNFDEIIDELLDLSKNKGAWVFVGEANPGFSEAAATLTSSLQATLQKLRRSVISFYKVAQSDVNAFEKLIETEMSTTQAKLKDLIKSYVKETKTLKVLRNVTDDAGGCLAEKKDADADFTSCIQADDLLRKLLLLEKELISINQSSIEEIEAATIRFEAIFESKAKSLSETVAEIIKCIEEADNIYASCAGGYLKSDVEKLELALETSGYSDFKQLAQKEDILTNFNAATEQRLTLIQNREDALQQAITNWCKTLFHQHRETVMKENLQRLEDIQKFVQYSFASQGLDSIYGLQEPNTEQPAST